MSSINKISTRVVKMKKSFFEQATRTPFKKLNCDFCFRIIREIHFKVTAWTHAVLSQIILDSIVVAALVVAAHVVAALVVAALFVAAVAVGFFST